MNTTAQRTPKSGRQSLFYQDLASPISSRRGSKFTTPGQAAAVSALWKENFSSSDLPPPPVFTLEDRFDFSPESGIADYPMSPEVKSDPRTPFQSSGFSGREFSTPMSKGEASSSYSMFSGQQLQRQQSQGSGSSWWTPPGRCGSSGGAGVETEEKGKGSPVDGVVQPGSLITLPPPREVARPEMQKNASPMGNLNEEEWVTVYGFSPGDTNLVLREFEKCGFILKHVPGPRNANWMHILYQEPYIMDGERMAPIEPYAPTPNRSDAQKALNKNGMQINGVLIVGVKRVDPAQHQALNERLNNHGFMPLPHTPSVKSFEPTSSRASTQPNYLQNGSTSARQSGSSMAIPTKSAVSKAFDFVFGV